MENGKLIKLIGVVVGMFCTPFFHSYAYDAETTHPALTQEIIKFFEANYPLFVLSEADKNSLERGSQEEDLPVIRCLNHFYDPLSGKGLKGYVSAPRWAQAPRLQALLDGAYMARLAGATQPLFAATTDYTFQRAVFEYVYGNRQRGLESLGHILHLLEDMAVPDHTRDDSHIFGSPYEEYAQRWTKDKIATAQFLLEGGEKPIVYQRLTDYFSHLALFSNQHFFSQDSILSKRYPDPVIDSFSEEGNDVFGNVIIGSDLYKLVKIETIFDHGTLHKSYFIEDVENLIFADYWEALSREVVKSGVGVMRLFFDAVVEERQTRALLAKNKSGWDTVIAGAVALGKKTGQFFSDLAKVIDQTLTKVEPKDLVAEVAGEKNQEGGQAVGGSAVNGSSPPTPQPLASQPEDPGSPELQRLALILREANRMVGRIEIGLEGLIHQNEAGGSQENLIVEKEVKVEEKQAETKPQPALQFTYQAGFGGGGVVSSHSSHEILSTTTTLQETIIATTTPQEVVVATTTPTTVATQSADNNFDEVSEVSNEDIPPVSLTSPIITSPFNYYHSTSTTLIFSGTASSSQTVWNDFSSATTTVAADNRWEITLGDLSSGTTTIAFWVSEGTATSSSTSREVFVESYVATTTPVIIYEPLAVVINEIAWAGTDASSADEWIELYNRSDEDIDLSNWFLYSEDFSPVLEFSEAQDKIIEAHSYYLIERTADDTIKDISADFVTPFSGWTNSSGLSNSGEHLILAYKNAEQATTTVDEVAFATEEGGWIAKSDICEYGRCKTLEKYDINLAGTERSNWGLSLGKYIVNGEDTEGGVIRGTPKAKNSLSYQITKGSHLTEDKTLTQSQSPYLIADDGLIVDKGVTLTIGKGVVIKMVPSHINALFLINGNLQVLGGQVSDQVIFTTLSDDIGGDTNGDGDCISGEGGNCPGSNSSYWSQVVFASSEKSNLENVNFRFGGKRFSTNYPATMVLVDNSEVDFTNVSFENSATTGLYLKEATTVIDNSYFKNNKLTENYDDPTYFGLFAVHGNVTVKNSYFEGNQVGSFFLDVVGAVLDSNYFTNHPKNVGKDDYRDSPLILDGCSGFTLTNTTGKGNFKDAIAIQGYFARQGSDTILTANPLPYLLERDMITEPNSNLTIDSGVVIKFNDNCVNCGTLAVNGSLVVNGGEKEEEKVIFTSAYDDSDGTDVYNDGETEGEISGKQQQIVLIGHSPVIKNAEFRYLYHALSFINSKTIDLNLENILFEHNTWSIQSDTEDVQVTFAENLIFATSTSQSMNWDIEQSLQQAKDNGANIIW